MQGREALLGGSRHLSVVLDQDAGDLLLAFLGCNVESGVEVLGDGVHLGSGLQKKHNNVNVAQAGGDVQRCLLLLRRYVFKKQFTVCDSYRFEKNDFEYFHE